MTRIFIETKISEKKDKLTNEERFIRHLIALLVSDTADVKITGTDGYTNLNKYEEQMKRNTANGGKNLVVFDADSAVNGGGFESRKSYLLDIQEQHGMDFELFLYPNNQSDGMFEDLLETIIAEQHKPILACFANYQNCIESKNEKGNYSLPIQKTKMYAYIDAMKKTQAQEKAFKNGDWFFEDDALWNFSVESLNPLKEFFQSNI
jgi:hypothetical protein